MMIRVLGLAAAGAAMLTAASAMAQSQGTVPAAPLPNARAKSFADSRYGVRFQVPPGWSVTRHDGEVSTFRLDAPTAPRSSLLRGVVSIDFNPFPHSTLAGALLYYSVQPNADEQSCANQARRGAGKPDVQGIGGMGFTHGHEERGDICVENRDEVYTAYRKHACYRFDVTVNTFCSAASGARDLTGPELRDIDGRMSSILSTVTLSWEKSGAQKVAVPELPESGARPTALAPAGGGL
jgi:hypothetical protein